MRLVIFCVWIGASVQAQYRTATLCETQLAAKDGDRLTIQSYVVGELQHGHWWLEADRSCGTSAAPKIPLVGQDHGNVKWQQWAQSSDAQAFLLFRKLKLSGEIQGVTFQVHGTIRRNPYWWLALKAYQLGLFPLAESTDIAPVALIVDSAEIVRYR